MTVYHFTYIINNIIQTVINFYGFILKKFFLFVKIFNEIRLWQKI